MLRFSEPGSRPPAWRPIAAAGLLLLLAGCTRTSVPFPEQQTQTAQRPAPTPEASPPPTPRPIFDIRPFVEPVYSVVWVPKGESLVVRQPAGISSVGIDSLAADQGGIHLTGKTTLLGSSQWLEIYLPDGGMGWVNGWNLTEQVEGEDFCKDLRVLDLLARLTQALTAADGGRLAELVSPRRGLIVRHNAWNPEVLFELPAVQSLFDEPIVQDWGIFRDSQVPIAGTFTEIIVPKLDLVLNAAPEVSCNLMGVGDSAQAPQWPPEYTNLNFYSFYRRAPDPGNRLNWHTWAVGIEYVGGEPYIAVLVHFQGEI